MSGNGTALDLASSAVGVPERLRRLLGDRDEGDLALPSSGVPKGVPGDFSPSGAFGSIFLGGWENKSGLAKVESSTPAAPSNP